MEITEVRIKLMEDSDDRLQAFCSITFDNAFVIRDLKIIDGDHGPFVAMPSRKLTAHCPQCRAKNHLRAAFCNSCGVALHWDRPQRDADGRAKLYADVAHPIHRRCREMIQERVIAEFEAELKRAEEPGYTSRYDDDYDSEDAPVLDAAELDAMVQPSAPAPRTHSPVDNHGSETAPRGSRVDPTKLAAPAPPPLLPPPKSRPSAPQAPESQPPPPHSPPDRTSHSSAAKSTRRTEFGAGVFDDERRSS